MISFSKTLILIGLLLTVTGGLIYLLAKAGIPIGRLPGDIKIERGNFTCLIALGSSILLSLLLTVLLNIFSRFFNK